MGRIVCLVLLLGCFTGAARAEVIGIGLDWRKNVFIQEYWQAGAPRYLIANLGKEPVKVAVYNRQAAGPALAGPWEVPANGIIRVDAPNAMAEGLLQFKLADGTSLGLLGAPVAPASLAKDRTVSNDGLNGSGGRQRDLWCEQEKAAFPAGGIIEVTLLIPAGKGTVTFQKKKGLDTPPEAVIREARSETLTVQATDKEIRIDSNRPLKEAKLHTVTLRFDAPPVTAPTLVAIDAWCATGKGGGFHIIRGVVVEPAKAP
jgi:hypothetical protein